MWCGLSHGSTPLAPQVFAIGTLAAVAKARSPSMLRVPTTPGPASTTRCPSGNASGCPSVSWSGSSPSAYAIAAGTSTRSNSSAIDPTSVSSAPARSKMPTVSMRASSHGGSAARRYSPCPMPERNLYLHEVIDIVGEGAMRYMEHTVGFNADAAADRGLELVGTWYTMGSTGRWPQVVNLWECVDGWSGWRRLMESTNLRRTNTPALVQWWQEALKSRTGGFDRLLGAALDYLAAVRETRAPLLADHGHVLVGLYEGLLTDFEVLTIWATDPAGHEALMRAADSGNDERFAAWHEQARAAGRTRWREELMTPHPE